MEILLKLTCWFADPAQPIWANIEGAGYHPRRQSPSLTAPPRWSTPRRPVRVRPPEGCSRKETQVTPERHTMSEPSTNVPGEVADAQVNDAQVDEATDTNAVEKV